MQRTATVYGVLFCSRVYKILEKREKFTYRVFYEKRP